MKVKCINDMVDGLTHGKAYDVKFSKAHQYSLNDDYGVQNEFNISRFEVVTEWDGEGLPPVGAKCLARMRGGSLGWMESTFKGGFDSKIWFGTIGCEYTVPAHDVEFKPVDTRTDEEKAIDDIINSRKFCSAKKDTESLIKAIKADKIHGIKWVGK